MPAHIKASGGWREVQQIYAKDGGAWRDIQTAYCKSGGVWREVYSAFKFETVMVTGVSAEDSNIRGYWIGPPDYASVMGSLSNPNFTSSIRIEMIRLTRRPNYWDEIEIGFTQSSGQRLYDVPFTYISINGIRYENAYKTGKSYRTMNGRQATVYRWNNNPNTPFWQAGGYVSIVIR